MHYIYVLYSEKDKKRYTGYSSDLRKRIKDHIEGKVEITKNRRPLRLVYYEAFEDENAARKQELYYKTGQGRRILNKRLYFLE